MAQSSVHSSNCRQVFMASMAFFIPIDGLSADYKERMQECAPASVSFAHRYSAELRIKNVGKLDSKFHKSDRFYFDSQDEYCTPLRRPVTLYPNLVKFRIGNNRCQYYLMILAEINKVFQENPECIKNKEYCTPIDLVYLKKAIYDEEKCRFYSCQENSDGNVIKFGDWLNSILSKLVGSIFLPYIEKTVIASIVKIVVQDIDAGEITTEEELTKAFADAHIGKMQKVEAFLSDSNNFDPIEHTRQSSDMEKFVYGLLYANNNFLQLHDKCVKHKISDFYSNNYSEQYWAVPNNIVSIHTGYPFRRATTDKPSVAGVSGSHLFHDCITDMCMLLMLDGLIKEFGNNGKMKSHEIERKRSSILEYFNETVYNVLELDERLHFFMSSFGLREKFDKVQNVVAPRRNAMESVFAMTSAIIAWLIGLLSVIIALINKF